MGAVSICLVFTGLLSQALIEMLLDVWAGTNGYCASQGRLQDRGGKRHEMELTACGSGRPVPVPTVLTVAVKMPLPSPGLSQSLSRLWPMPQLLAPAPLVSSWTMPLRCPVALLSVPEAPAQLLMPSMGPMAPGILPSLKKGTHMVSPGADTWLFSHYSFQQLPKVGFQPCFMGEETPGSGPVCPQICLLKFGLLAIWQGC